MHNYKSWKNELEQVDKIEGLLVPGQEKAFILLASSLNNNSTVVEIGSFKGKSTACIACEEEGIKIKLLHSGKVYK